MGPYIIARWGWDEQAQRQIHGQRWHEKPWQIVYMSGVPIGTVSINWRPTHMQFGEFYLLSEYRRRGIGSQILKNALNEADERNVETRLEYLKWNPVATLYMRNGFTVVSENEIHVFAVRKPHAPQQVSGAQP